MEHLDSFADRRLVASCVHCSGATETRDHVPSRILLDEPYPANLPVVPACASCNTGFSLDETYFACLVECARTGSVEAVQREKIRRILEQTPALAAKIMQARTAAPAGDISFTFEKERVQNVVVKLARCHAAHELSEPQHDEPSHIMFTPLHLLSNESRQHFETPPQPSAWPEVGSRAMQRLVISDGQVFGPQWIQIQEGQYRFVAVAEGAVMVRFVVGEYLACEVIWGGDEA